MDQLEDVLAGLDGARPPVGDRPLRIGAAAELFDAYLLPRLATAVAAPLVGTFGSDAFLIDADVRLSAPDLRVVAAAVERGVGFSLLPGYTCHQALDEGGLVRLYDVSRLVSADPWLATTRRSDAARPELVVATRLQRDQSSSANGMPRE